MGAAILQSLLRARGISSRQVTVIERNTVKRRQLKDHFLVDVQAVLLASHLSSVDVVIIAIKPQNFPAVTGYIRDHFPKPGLLVSVMAGVKISTIKSSTNCSRIIRIMPNLPMAVGKGFSAWFATRSVSKKQKNFVHKILAAGGEQIQINKENLFDAITAISGSGPAYLFTFVADLMNAAQQLGVETVEARKMVLQTLKGSLALLENSTDSADSWRKRVTSKGGTTAAAFKVLRKGGLDKLWLSAIQAAHRRSRQLSVLLDKILRE